MFNTNNLNGALFPLHTHLNHSCEPNTKVIDSPGRLADVSGTVTLLLNNVLTKVVSLGKTIEPDEEIAVSYVNPEWPVSLRRETLKRDYGFDCQCQKCQLEGQI